MLSSACIRLGMPGPSRRMLGGTGVISALGLLLRLPALRSRPCGGWS